MYVQIIVLFCVYTVYPFCALPAAPPTFTVTNLPTIVTVSEFARVELPCTASGRPVPDVTWSKQGSSVGEVEGARVVKLESGTLEIGNAARDDEGEYKCRVANAAGEQFHTIRLNVTSECAATCIASMH